MHPADAARRPREPFEATLDELDDLLAEARGGSRLALLDGPPGVGIEAVLRMLAARAPGPFLRVRAQPGHPLAPVEGMILPLLERRRRRSPAAPIDRAFSCIAGCHALWFEHGGAASGGWGRLAERRASLFDAVFRLFASLDEPGPPVVVIDDLEHLDRQTAALLASMLDQEVLGIRAPGALFVGVRPAREGIGLASLRGLSAVRCVSVRPLTAEELSAYLARPETAASIHAATRGLVDRLDAIFASDPPPILRPCAQVPAPASDASVASDVTRAVQAAERLVARHAPEEAEQRLAQAAEALAAADASRAGALFVKLAELRRMLGDIDGALAAAERALDAPGGRLLRARLLAAAGRDRHARTALEQIRAQGLPEERRRATAELAILAARAADHTHAATLAREVLDSRDDDEPAMEARNVLGNVAWAEGDLVESERLHAENRRAAAQAGLPSIVMKASNNMALVELSRGRHHAARGLLEQVVELARDHGAARDRAIALENLGVIDRLRGRYADAIAHYQAAVRLLKPLDERLLLARAATNLAEVYATLGDARRALALVKLGEGIGIDAQYPEVRALRMLVASEVHDIAGEAALAMRIGEDALAGARAAGSRRVELQATIWLATLEERHGEVERAAARLDALGPVTKIPDRARLALVRARLGRGGDGALARALHAIELAIEAGEETIELEARTEHAALLLEAGLVDEAAEEHGEARAIAARLAARVPADLGEHWRARPACVRLAKLEARLRAGGAHRIAPASSALERIVGTSAPIVRLKQWLERVAPASTTVLVLGESGTGKELFTEALHELSPRRAGPFVRVNCGALVETMRESELFGHERGAFTGAERRRPGYFELANGGTIFLDEIGDTPPSIQVALLRVLQDRRFHRVGATSPIEVDVRVVAATNRDLEAMVAAGTFRSDLYYRLCGLTVRISPLRERVSDLPLLVEALLERIRRDEGIAQLEVERDALEYLAALPWPGNVRQLAGVLRSVAVLSGRRVLRRADFVEHASSAGSLDAAPASLSLLDHYWQEVSARGSIYELRQELERAAIARAFAEEGGNITKAAARLGMKRPRLSGLVREYGLKDGIDEGSDEP